MERRSLMASVRLMKGRGTWFPAAKLLLAGLLSACGGGGSGGGGSALPPPSGGPTPTPPPSFGVAGILTDADTGAALGGATVTLGALPNATTCNRAQTDTFNACGANGACSNNRYQRLWSIQPRPRGGWHVHARDRGAELCDVPPRG